MEAVEVCAEYVYLLVSGRKFLLEDEPNIGKRWGGIRVGGGLGGLGRWGKGLRLGCWRGLGVEGGWGVC